MLHRHNAQNPVHAAYTSAALQPKLQKALFVTAVTPLRFGTSYRALLESIFVAQAQC